MARDRALLIGMIAATVAACGAEGPPTFIDDPFENPIFAGAARIEVFSPGELCRVDDEPQFVWQGTGSRLVHAAVFDQNVDLQNGRIANPEANVWAWHSGMGRGVEGAIRYQDGLTVQDGVIQEGTAPAPLTQGESYIWGVWAWNETGTRVTHASRPVFFTVDTTSVGCPAP